MKPIILLLISAFAASAQTITGAGATFPAPLYQRWLESFQASQPGLPIRYEPVGSAEGLRRLRAGETEFAASDIPVTDASVACIPVVIGAVVPVYNLPGVARDLSFTPEALAGIFAGRIRRWNDPAIRQSNRRIALPAADIAVVHRADGSGTTFVWTGFLSAFDEGFKSVAGQGAEVKWPVGTGAQGNEGVARAVRATPFSIGYVEFIYALKERLSYGAVQNAAGRFVQPATESIRAATVDTHRPDAYPVPALTYFVLPVRPPGKPEASEKRNRVLDFVGWTLTAGQNDAAALGFIALPREQLDKAGAAVAGLR